MAHHNSFLINCPLWKKFLFYYKRFILMKNVRKLNLLKMFVPDKEEKFYRSSEIF